ncbi:hypothetical protein K7432_002831 [Basidiobolus ranarum]|uniref:Uncharacterized protein n=1 Tax=Basidiobolus ranarum TaxID=34480 RepID=A0ABR2W743_9FUNG
MKTPKSSYPIQGVLFFVAHPSLWGKCLHGILFLAIVSVVSLIGFGFVIPPTAHALIRVNCPSGLAWFVAVVFMLIETFLVLFLCYILFLPLVLDRLFDAVLKLRGLGNHVPANRGYLRRIGFAGLRYVRYRLFGELLVELPTLILTLPLNVVPGLGTGLYCYLNGLFLTWGYMLHYHVEILGLNLSQSRELVMKNRMDYTTFGAVALALQLVPLGNFIFMFTNVVGCALWAADELNERIEEGHVPPKTNESLQTEHPPLPPRPTYH